MKVIEFKKSHSVWHNTQILIITLFVRQHNINIKEQRAIVLILKIL